MLVRRMWRWLKVEKVRMRRLMKMRMRIGEGRGISLSWWMRVGMRLRMTIDNTV